MNRSKSWLLFGLIAMLWACQAGPAVDNKAYQALSNADKIKFNQDILQGQILYITHCSNCHQADGSGLGQLIPPLAGADYLIENPGKAICGIKNGMKGEIVVNGVSYNQPMPANPKLTALEIAQIMTYIGNTWGNEMGLFTTKDVTDALAECD